MFDFALLLELARTLGTCVVEAPAGSSENNKHDQFDFLFM